VSKQSIGAREGYPEITCEPVFAPAEVEVLRALQPRLEGKTEQQKNPHAKNTLAWAA